MIRANKLTEILKDFIKETDFKGIVIMTTQGSVISSVVIDSSCTETVLAALSSCVWTNYAEGAASLSTLLIKLEHGIAGISAIGQGEYLVAILGGSDTPPGLLRGRLQAACAYFSQVFGQLK